MALDTNHKIVKSYITLVQGMLNSVILKNIGKILHLPTYIKTISR